MHTQIEKLLKLPLKQKIIIFIVVLAMEAFLLIWFIYRPAYQLHETLKTDLSKLQNEIDEKTRIVANLPKLQQEYDALNRELILALAELPNSKEIPSLLTSITNLGKSAGLDFLVFKPRPEQMKEFYAEVPVEISVSGTFHSVANFFVTVSNLPRIVNISNVAFTDIKSTNNKTLAKINCLAITFRFLDNKEIKNETKTNKK